MADRVVVIDNGGCTCKVGFGGQDEPIKVFPNCSAKPKGERQVYLADALLTAPDISQLTVRRPIDRGFVVNWGLQRDIWGRALTRLLRAEPRECGLALSEPLMNLPNVRDTMYQVVFEEYGFKSFHPAPASFWAAHNYSLHGAGSSASGDHGRALLYQAAAPRSPACVVVDAGFSSSTVAPFFDGVLLEPAVRRINVGGKLLTNYLKELASYRSVNVMDEHLLVEHIKEQVCFVSQDVTTDLRASSRGVRSVHRREYVLPDGLHSTWGHLRDPAESAAAAAAARQQRQQPGVGPPVGPKEQVLLLNNERFMVPELLLSPSDLGLRQAGLAEALAAAVAAAPEQLHGMLYSNIVLTGGTARLPGLRDRLYTELRALAPQEYDVAISVPQEPITYAWKGGSQLAADPHGYAALAMTRAQYEEEGAPPANRAMSA